MSHGQRPPSAGRRRVSQRTYMVRRFVVLTVVVGLAWAVAAAVGSAFGGDDAKEAEAVSPTTNTFVSDGTPTTQTLPPTTTTEPPVKEVTVPSAADPAEVLILGDSDAGTFGPYLKTLLDGTGIVTTELDYKTSSGLSRPDFFDWPTYMQQVVPQVNPDIVIVTFGGNDAQGLRNVDKSWAVERTPTADDTEWREEYGRRVGAVMDYLGDGNRTLIWVGIPNDDNPEVTARMQVQDEVVRAEVAKREKVVFIDTWARFSGRNGGWAEYVIDPRDGEGKDVRADDGFHLNVTGAEILALDISDAVRTALRDRGAAI
jgi:hypothetical protein